MGLPIIIIFKNAKIKGRSGWNRNLIKKEFFSSIEFEKKKQQTILLLLLLKRLIQFIWPNGSFSLYIIFQTKQKK